MLDAEMMDGEAEMTERAVDEQRGRNVRRCNDGRRSRNDRQK